jgi:hypothetical protein
MQFAQALDHYKSALEEDSAFVLAASRGSYAANWLSEFDEGTRLADIALRDPRSLSVAQLLLTRGLRAYLTGSADSAVSFLRQALQRDSLIHAGWTVLGEVYSRLLPDVWSADSLARDALFRARRIDPDFAPSLLLLEENALRNGNIAGALLLRGELQRAGADTTHEFSRRLMLSCIRDGPTAVDWARALRKSELDVLSSGKILGGHAAQPGCAIGFFSAVVTGDSVSRSGRWAGFVGLQAQLAAVQRSSQAAKMFERRELAGLPIKLMYPLLAAAGAGFDAEARKVADSVAAHYERSSAPALWHFATWEASRKNAERVRKIAQVLSHKADSSGSRRDRLIRDAIAARLRLLEGDSVAALAMLRALTPSAPRQQITYDAWESLGPERLQLAQLLYARGLFAEAYGVATELDATEPLTYPLYLRASIALRLHIAEIWKNAKLTAEYRRRMSALNWSG